MNTLPSKLAEDLRAEVGDPLRVVAEYEAESYTIHYLREDVGHLYTTEQIGEIAEELVLEGLERIRLEDLFEAGDLQCSIHTFERATMCQFVRDDFGGLFVSIDSDPGVNIIDIRRENPRLQSWDESPHGSQPLKTQQLSAHTAFL